MKLFIDSANIEEIAAAVELGIICGATTNPSLVAKQGQRDFPALLCQILTLIEGPISAEVMSLSADEMVQEALPLAHLDMQRIAIKIPMCAEGLKAVKRLSDAGVTTNVTLIFSATQALLAAAAGANFVSPFVGRLDDVSQDGIDVVRDIVDVFEYHKIATEVIAASIRSPIHVLEAAKSGAHIATVPYRILEQMIDHPLTTAGIKRFQEDWQKLVN